MTHLRLHYITARRTVRGIAAHAVLDVVVDVEVGFLVGEFPVGELVEYLGSHWMGDYRSPKPEAQVEVEFGGASG